VNKSKEKLPTEAEAKVFGDELVAYLTKYEELIQLSFKNVYGFLPDKVSATVSPWETTKLYVTLDMTHTSKSSELFEKGRRDKHADLIASVVDTVLSMRENQRGHPITIERITFKIKEAKYEYWKRKYDESWVFISARG